jgi:hypothetical protein
MVPTKTTLDATKEFGKARLQPLGYLLDVDK